MKTLELGSLFNKVTGLRWLQHRCFPVNFVKFLRKSFLQNKPREQLLVVLQKTRFVIKDFFSKYEQANNLQRTYPHMLKKSIYTYVLLLWSFL